MNQDVKAYPKPEKEVLCSECGKPILTRSDLYFCAMKASIRVTDYLPIHLDCYTSILRSNKNAPKPFDFESFDIANKKLKKFARAFFYIPIFLLPITIFLIWATGSWRESSVIVGISIASLVFVWLSRFQHKTYKILWKKYAQHLPEKSSKEIEI